MRLNLSNDGWAIAARVLAAVVGGYALAFAATACLTLALPLARIEATLTATMASYLLYALAVMWSFASRTAVRAWIGLLVPTALLAAASYALHRGIA